MKTITAIEKYEKRSSDEIFTFLAGGITNCKERQKSSQFVRNKLDKLVKEFLEEYKKLWNHCLFVIL